MEIEDPLTFEEQPSIDCVYINLDKRVDRKKLMQGELRAQGMKGRRFSAKSGDDVKDTLVTRQWHSKLNCLYDRKTLPALHNMSKGERGCSGSHIALWKQCLRRNDPTKPMLILEDDAVLWERSGVKLPELTQRLIAAVEQCWDVENTPVMLYVGCEVVQVREENAHAPLPRGSGGRVARLTRHPPPLTPRPRAMRKSCLLAVGCYALPPRALLAAAPS